MKLTKDGADVCNVGFITYGPMLTEQLGAFLGKLGVDTKTEQTYYVECPRLLAFGAGKYRLVGEVEGLDVAIDPIGPFTEEGEDSLGKPIYRMQCYIYWPKKQE